MQKLSHSVGMIKELNIRNCRRTSSFHRTKLHVIWETRHKSQSVLKSVIKYPQRHHNRVSSRNSTNKCKRTSLKIQINLNLIHFALKSWAKKLKEKINQSIWIQIILYHHRWSLPHKSIMLQVFSQVSLTFKSMKNQIITKRMAHQKIVRLRFNKQRTQMRILEISKLSKCVSKLNKFHLKQ